MFMHKVNNNILAVQSTVNTISSNGLADGQYILPLTTVKHTWIFPLFSSIAIVGPVKSITISEKELD